MKLKDFMNLHAVNFNYEIQLKRIDRDSGEAIYIEYADSLDSPWQRYFSEFFDCEVNFFKVETVKDFIGPKTVLVIYITF